MMKSEINKQIAELLLKQTYAERMVFADIWHTYVQSVIESNGEFPNVQDVADAIEDMAIAINRPTQ